MHSMTVYNRRIVEAYNANTVEHVLTVLLDRVILLPIGYTHVQINRAGGIYEERTVSALGKIGKCKT